MRKTLITLSCIALLPTIISCGNANKKADKVAVKSCMKEEKPIMCLSDLAYNKNSQAQVTLGDIYLQGTNGVTQNYNKAIDFYMASAEQNFVEGQVSLAKAYENNHTKEDDIKAYAWRLILVNTHKQKYDFKALEIHMTDDDVNKAKALEKELLKKIKSPAE